MKKVYGKLGLIKRLIMVFLAEEWGFCRWQERFFQDFWGGNPDEIAKATSHGARIENCENYPALTRLRHPTSPKLRMTRRLRTDRGKGAK